MGVYEYIILGCWAIYLLVWGVSALNVKRDIPARHGNIWQQFWLLRIIIVVLVLIFVAVRIATGTAHFTNFGLIFYVFRACFFARPLTAVHTPRLGGGGAFRYRRECCHLGQGASRA